MSLRYEDLTTEERAHQYAPSRSWLAAQRRLADPVQVIGSRPLRRHRRLASCSSTRRVSLTRDWTSSFRKI